jgi:hypothetical protein
VLDQAQKSPAVTDVVSLTVYILCNAMKSVVKEKVQWKSAYQFEAPQGGSTETV